MKRLYSLIDKILPVLPYLIVFISSLDVPSDPDIGWHLKYGEYFLQHGQILRDNIFSTMMPHYQWANVSWFIDVITYIVFHFGGFYGLSLLSAAVVTLTFFIVSKTARFTVWEEIFLFPVLLYLENPLNIVSFRGQQITLLLVCLLIYILSTYAKKPKKLYFLIPLFIFWVNVSGEFLLGIGLLAIWIVTFLATSLYQTWHEHRRSIHYSQKKKTNVHPVKILVTWFSNKRKEIFFLSAIFLVSCLSTLVNPYGIGVHLIAFSHFGSPLLKDVAEYLPFDTLSQAWWNQIFVAIAFAISLTYLYFRRRLPTLLPTLACAVCIFVLSFEVRRYAWPAYYLIFPFLIAIPAYFKPNSKFITRLASVFLLLLILIVIIAGKWPLRQYYTYNWNTYCQQEFILCSPAASGFLVKHPQYTKNLFSLYGWGGWLIWNYPSVKPTIDGRMHLWRDNNGYSAFEDYYGYEQNVKDINKSKYTTVYISPDKPLYKYILQLTQTGQWKNVYQDKYAGIFIKNR